MEKAWSQIDLRANIKHGVLEREDKTEVLSSKWKYLIRKGVPMKLMKPIILDIYKRTFADNKMEYQIALKIVFKDTVPANIKQNPIFNHENRSLEEIVKINILNKEGFDALRRILYILKEMYYQIEYNPMIIQIASLLLVFIKEEEAYCVLKYMIEDSIKILNSNSEDQVIQRSLRWHFLMNKNDFVRYERAFFDTLVQKSATFKQIMDHFKEINFDYIEYFMDITNNIFYGYLSFSAVIKIFIMYMNEGIKVYFRFLYSLCYTLKDNILKVRDRSTMKSLIRNKALNLNLKQIRNLIQKGFGLRLNKISKQLQNYSSSKNQKGEFKKIYYLPHLDSQSNIIQQEQLEIIWDWLPSSLKLTDPVQIWATHKDGYQLSDLYKRCEEHKGRQMLILIKADINNSIFGVYCDEIFQFDANKVNYYGGNETFVFQLHPNIIKFDSIGKEPQHCLSTKDYFSFGSNGNAIKIDQEFNKGRSEVSQTYNNQVLTGSQDKQDFICQDFELYIFE